MNWAHFAIEALERGESPTITPRGNSMKGKINDGDTVVLSPVPEILSVGDIVLVKVKGKIYLHLIKAARDKQYLIGNNRGGENGWVTISAIYGIAVSVNGKAL